MAEVPSTFALPLGASAPDFTLPDASGQSHTLQTLRGAQGTLVVFACNHCPYVIHIASLLGAMAAEFQKLGIQFVAISSNDIEKYPQDAPPLMREFATASGWDFPYLFDETQEVAQAYKAACTPDFFLFDANLNLFYAGQFDESRPKNGLSATGKDLRQALEALLAGNPAPTPQIPATGCNIKWKPGVEPAWFSPVPKPVAQG